jgi:hypothetical protein
MENLCIQHAKFEVEEKDGYFVYEGHEFDIHIELVKISSHAFRQQPVIKKIWFINGYLFLDYHLRRGKWSYIIDGKTFVRYS